MHEVFQDLFIFEMANNHQGSLEHGLRIIEAMGEIASRQGIRAAVKFQYRDLDSFIHPQYRDRQDVKHIPRFLATRLEDREFRELVAAVRAAGLIPMCTPFDEPSVDRCRQHGMEILKVASCSAADWPLLEAVARAGKPVVVSTAGLELTQIDNLVSFFGHRKVDLALMHCVALYPTPPEKVAMNFLERLIRRYPFLPVGYSGHEAPDELDVVKVAVSKGACLLERHVGVATGEISLNAYSMNPEQVEAWVASALKARRICGQGWERPHDQAEQESLLSLQRGVYAARTISRGQGLGREDVFFAMPCQPGQTTSGQFGRKRARFRAGREYQAQEPIRESSPPDSITRAREIIHHCRGMLHEAGIILGDGCEIELSHHYGLERFPQTGALIVNLVNREYCKKIVVMLAGQEHPCHRHQVKEETFQLLWGDLTVNLNQIEHHLRPGDMLLVERGAWHSFTTRGGAVFEEISTTQLPNDSYYQDPDIAALDPMERKTVVDSW